MSRVLIVDDEEGYREQLAAILIRAGHDVRTAADEQDAVQVAQRFVPQILLVDWLLGAESSGMQVAQTLQRFHHGLQVIVITGLSRTEIESQARLGQFPLHRCLEKPFGMEELLSAVGEAAAQEA